MVLSLSLSQTRTYNELHTICQNHNPKETREPHKFPEDERSLSLKQLVSKMNKRDVRGLRASARSAGILQYVLRKYTQTRGETNTRRTQLRTTNLERMIRLDVVRGRSVKLREL